MRIIKIFKDRKAAEECKTREAVYLRSHEKGISIVRMTGQCEGEEITGWAVVVIAE